MENIEHPKIRRESLAVLECGSWQRTGLASLSTRPVSTDGKAACAPTPHPPQSKTWRQFERTVESFDDLKIAGRSRAVLARERAATARAMLADCHFCAHHCGVNRLITPGGLCHAGAEARFFSAQIEVSDELELIPTFAIALSGCDLRCAFCITGAASWNARTGEGLNVLEMAERARRALDHGARTIMVLGGEPTIHLHAVLELVAELPDSVRLVWKTNAHGSAEARELLDGMFDVWLADFKFGNDACALRLARVPDYGRIVRENLLWFASQSHAEPRSPTRRENVGVQTSVCSEGTLKRELQRAEPVHGAPRSELIVRHLLMPGHVDCCWRPVAEWLAENLPGVKVNLRTGFWPAWQAARYRELRGTTAADESARAFEFARQLSLNLIP